MCRFALYAGEPIAAYPLIFEGEHSLYHQSYQPAELLSGSVNADGFGLGWYDRDLNSHPGTYRQSIPIWADRDLENLSRVVSSSLLLANVRNATDSFTAGRHAAHPFNAGPYLFMHNGAIEHFRESLKRPLRERLSDSGYAALQGASDSETIFYLLIDELEKGNGLTDAMQTVIALIEEQARPHNLTLQLNMALTDGKSAVVSRWANVEPSNSLYLLDRAGSFPQGTVVASEPLTTDDPWQAVPTGSIILLDPAKKAVVQPLTL